MILDTRFLGALVDGDDGARRTAATLDGSGAATRVPAVVLWEIHSGIGAAASPETTRELRGLYEPLLENQSTLALTPRVARRAGELNGEHARSDALADLDGADSVVAAHGLLLDEPVVSDDADFRDVDGLDIVTY